MVIVLKDRLKMRETTISNSNLQENEILVLSNIYNNNEFSYVKEDIIQCYYNVFPSVDNLLEVQNVYANFVFHSSCKYYIKYLPPIRVYLQLPIDYPIKKSPYFYIIASWLSPWQISFICQKLDEIWLENKNQEILFLWFEFLRNDLLNFLKIKNILDISFINMAYYNITDYFKLSLTFQSDIRAVYSTLFSTPIQFLINYDNSQQKIMFENNYYICIICFNMYCGKDCIKLKTCGHIYCKECIQNYIAIKINECNVNDIFCPDVNCNLHILFDEVKWLCPELFSKYDNLLLYATLNAMEDIVFCPKISCQCPLIKNSDDMAVCSKCDHAFCTYCYKMYHGPIPCDMTSSEKNRLIEEYRKGNKHQRKLLEIKYGRKQLQKVVEDQLTKEYLKTNTKTCPTCSTVIQKNDGCNKITCFYCKTNFCWLCGVMIAARNPYHHFLTGDNNCYKRLFDIIGEEDH